MDNLNSSATPAGQTSTAPSQESSNSQSSNGATTQTQNGGSDNGSYFNNESDKGQPNPGETPAQKEKRLKKFELQVRGKKIEKEIDLNDEEYLKKVLQLSENANYVTQEVRDKEKNLKQKEQEIQKILESGKENKAELFKKFGITKEELMDYLIEQEELDMMSPEEKEYLELKKFKETHEQTEKQQKEQAYKEKVKAKSQETAQKIQKELFEEIIQKEGFLQKVTENGKPSEASIDILIGVVSLMKEAKAEGFDLTVKEAYDEFNAIDTEKFDRKITSYTDDALIQKIGHDRMKQMIKRYSEMLNATSDIGEKKHEVKNTGSLDAKPKKYIKPSEWRNL